MPPLADVRIADAERWDEFRDGLLGHPPAHRLLGYPDAPNGGNPVFDSR